MRFAIKSDNQKTVKADREYLPTYPPDDPYYHDSGELYITVDNVYVTFNRDEELDPKTLNREIYFYDLDEQLMDQEFGEPILMGFEAQEIVIEEMYNALYNTFDPVPGMTYRFNGSVTVPYSMWVLEKWARIEQARSGEDVRAIDEESISVDVNHIENNISVTEVK